MLHFNVIAFPLAKISKISETSKKKVENVTKVKEKGESPPLFLILRRPFQALSPVL